LYGTRSTEYIDDAASSAEGSMTSSRPPRPERNDALPILLETERHLAARLDVARREADALVAAAEAEAARQLAQLDDDLVAEGEAVARSVEAGAANRIEELRREADATVARYRALSDDAILELARDVVALVVDEPVEGST
jgi:vacuolar-type H+-ATPase subunit H